MMKHVGKHSEKKIIILWRKVPDEEHMALVVYTNSLPTIMHDTIMKVLESEVGQQAKEFSEALNRSMLSDGRLALNALHTEGLIKKVPTNQVSVTPTTTSSVRLDELNKIVDDMDKGEEAIAQMAALDSQRGLRGGNPNARAVGEPVAASVNTPSTLGDEELAETWVAQAAKLRSDATMLITEAVQLEQNATSLVPAKTKADTKRKPAKLKKETSNQETHDS